MSSIRTAPDRSRSSTSPRAPGLTIVTPSFEKHFVQFVAMIESLDRWCEDPEFIYLAVVVERVNEARFREALAAFPQLKSRVILTEDLLAQFGVRERPSAFLKRIGKFTFQTLKKLGALASAETDWSLVLDSEGLFHKPFRAADLLNDYAERKYVFYTETGPRGKLWRASTGFDVTQNAATALNVPAGDRWYMEYFHWFYETDKVRELLTSALRPLFFEALTNSAKGHVDHFENILYYLFLQNRYADEYRFLDLVELLASYLPEGIAARFSLDQLPFALFGNDYLLNILAPEDVPALASLFDAFRLPFIRLEPPFFSPLYLEELQKLPTFVATISSHHAAWLRKKVAVCVSGEFRHLIHRTPEHQTRHLLGFLSGVDCDVFLHSWSTPDEALIRRVLQPKACRFEPRPSFADLAARITVREPRLKPGRDEGSLAMFHGMREAFRLVEGHLGEYDYIVRIRPDLFSEMSLKEILVKISDEGDLLRDTVYVPKHFHSKGINDQLAIGPTAQMQVYLDTLSFIERELEQLFFNPESVLLQNLIDHDVKLAVVDVPYALMRETPMKIGSVHEHFTRQFDVWWSRTDDLPQYEDVSSYFADKLRGIEALMRGDAPDALDLVLEAEGGGRVLVRTQAVDNDPVRRANAIFERAGFDVAAPFIVADGRVAQAADPEAKQVFVYPDEAWGFVFVEWRMKAGRFTRHAAPATTPGGSRTSVGEAASARALYLGGADRSELRRRRPEPGRLLVDDQLEAGARLLSPGGVYAAALRADGRLQLVSTARPEAPPLWTSEAAPARALHLRMQQDGNLVIYTPDGQALWASGTQGAGLRLEVRDEGVLAVTDGADDLWRRPAPVRLYGPSAPPVRKGLSALLHRSGWPRAWRR